MNIGRTVDYALIKDEIHESDNRRAVCRRLHRRDIVGVCRPKRRLVVRHPFAELLDHVGHGIVGVAIILRNARHHIRLAGEDETDLLGKRKEHFV